MNLPIVTAALMAATMMISLDTTIANVALPHMQGSVSASNDQITWVLTSYMVAAAILTPLSGWLSGRVGRKNLLRISIIGFTIASALCGISTSLAELVGFRLLQGVFGAAIVPVCQAVLLDIYPKEKHGQAMSIWGIGAILGPILGPALGGYLTEHLSWNWVFYINLPIGAIALFGMSFLKEQEAVPLQRLDLLGFGLLAVALASLQLMLDRGQQLDWFYSWEIRIEAGLCVLFFYLFIVQITTARSPFVDVALFKDRNFLFGSIFGFFVGVVLFGTLALLPPLLERLLNYPVLTTGLVTMPRGIGVLASMIAVGRLLRVMDARILMFTGLCISAVSLHWMSGFSLEMDSHLVVVSGLLQGVGIGLVMIPMVTVAFATLEPQYRDAGTAMFTLIRNVGGSIGISILSSLTVRNTAIVHSRLAEGVRPDNPVLQSTMPSFDFANPANIAAMNGQVTAQATMVSYTDAFWLLFVLTLCALPLVLLMRPADRNAERVTVVD